MTEDTPGRVSKDGEVIPSGPLDEKDDPEAVAKRRARQRSERRLQIRSGAILTPGYLFMNAMSAIIASYGLLADSPAVVIGAMIVALILGPITAMALAISDGDFRLVRRSGLSIFAGGAVVYLIALVIGWLHGNAPLTHEISSRTAPTIFDLAVALAGGAAAAYASTSERVSASVVGAAIATALVPPMAASAILLTRGEWEASGGALLLAAMNILGIQFAAAIVLWLTGISRDDDGYVGVADFLRRNAAGLVLLTGLGIVLATNLGKTLDQEVYRRDVRAKLSDAMSTMAGNRIVSLEVIPNDGGRVVRVSVDGPRKPTVAEVEQFAKLIPPAKDGTPISLRVRYTPIEIITSEGPGTDVLDAPLSGPPAPPPN